MFRFYWCTANVSPTFLSSSILYPPINHTHNYFYKCYIIYSLSETKIVSYGSIRRYSLKQKSNEDIQISKLLVLCAKFFQWWVVKLNGQVWWNTMRIARQKNPQYHSFCSEWVWTFWIKITLREEHNIQITSHNCP